MKQFSKDLGNVSIVPKGKWSREQEYEKLALVYNACDNLSYVAKINVPSGVDIENREYWQPMNATGYADNNFINLTTENENGTITAYETLEEAVATILPINRRAGATLSFYNLNSDRLDRQAEFELWQFNSTDLANWENKYYWNNVYYNWNVFVGWYIGDNALKNHVKLPTVGQYAYVGSNLNDAVLYQCSTNGIWTNTGTKVRNYMSVVVSGNITIGDNGNWFSDGKDTGIPATPAVDEQLDNIGLQLQQHSTEIDKLQKQDVALKSNIDSNFETINNKVDEIKTATDNKIDSADANLQKQITGNDNDIATLNTKHESLSKTVQGIAATGGASAATNVTYDKTNSGLNAENAQDAIDLLSKIGYNFKGLAKLTTKPNINVLEKAFYIASEVGEYINFLTNKENAPIVTNNGLYIFIKEDNSNYWKEYNLIEITKKLGNSEDKVINQKLASLISGYSSINVISDLDLIYKTEIGYLTNTGTIVAINSGIILSFTITKNMIDDDDLYLYVRGLADPTNDWATYVIFDSSKKVKYVGPTTLSINSVYRNGIIKIDKTNIVEGDIIKVSVSKLIGNAILFRTINNTISTFVPDIETSNTNITNALGTNQKLKVSVNINTLLQTCNSAINLNKNSRLNFKTKTGYLLSDGSVLNLSSGMILSFTIKENSLFVYNNKVITDLYLYIVGLADPYNSYISYIIYNSAGKIKHKGEQLNDINNYCKSSILRIDKNLIDVGDVIQVSVNKKFGGAVLLTENVSSDNFFYNFIIPDTEDEIITDNNSLNQWNGKKIVWIGTSIPWGQTSESGQTNPMANPYPNQIGELLGCTVLNHAQPGMAIRYNKDGTVRYGQCLSLTVKELQEKGLATTPFKSYENAVLGFDADLYVFDSEPNNGSVPSDGDLALLESFSIKNWAYADNSDFASHRDTFVGAFIYMYDKLLNEKPNAKVILVGEFGGTGIGEGNGNEWENEYYNHTLNIAIAEKFNLPIFSLFELLGYNPKNVDIYMNADRVHPKYAAHIRMANILKEKLLEIF